MYKYFYLVVASLLLLFPEANAGNLFEPAPNSLAVQIVDAIFGKLHGGGVDAFAGIMTVWNSSVLCIGGLLFGYTLIAITIGTAQDGEMLGKKFSSAWLPIRYCLAPALIMPVINGYCVMQFIVYWLVIQGIGLADKVWEQAVQSNNVSQTAAAGIMRPATKQFTYKLFETITCQTLLTKVYTTNKEAGKYLDGGSYFGITKTVGLTTTNYSWGDKKALSGFATNTCGSISIKNFSAPATEKSSSPVNFLFKAEEALARMSDINKEHHTQVGNLITKLQPYADKIIAGEIIDIKDIDNLSAEYEENVRMKAAVLVSKMDTFKDFSKNASNNGFITAGAWYMPIAFMSDMIQRSVADVPNATGPGNMDTILLREEWSAVRETMQKILAKADVMITTSTSIGVSAATGGETGWWDTIKDTVTGAGLTKLVDKAFSSGTQFVIGDNENPILAMKRLGNMLFGVASTAYIALTALSVTVGNLPGVGNALAVAVVLFITPILVAGFLLSYIFPLMPFFIWTGAVTAWILLVVEAIIAAPLWAVMHLTPHGDDMTGSGGNGYRLVLSLLLRPVLMVFGLVAALAITAVMGDVLNKMFAGVFILSQTDSGLLIKIFGNYVAAPIVYGAMMFTFVKKMFDIITHLPDELLNWIGGGGPQLGQFADAMGGERSHTYLAAAAVGGAAGRSAESITSKNSGADMSDKNDKGDGAQSRNDSMKANAVSMGSKQSSGGGSPGAMPGGKPGSSSPGSGGGGASSGGGSMHEQKIANQFANIESTLDGVGSPEYESFSNDLEKRMEENPDVPVMENMNDSFNRELNKTFGKNAGGNLKEISGGSYSGADFNTAVEQYKEAQVSLDNQGFDGKESKKIIESASASAKTQYKSDSESTANGGSKKLGDYLKNELTRAIRNS